MDTVSFKPARSPLLVLVVALLAAAFIVNKIRRFILRRQFLRQHGCKPVAHSIHKDPFLALDNAYALFRVLKEHRALPHSLDTFRKHGNTFVSDRLLDHHIITREPENIKAILAVNFKDYGIGFRLRTFGPLLGEGIFDSDGAHWAFSRGLVRPNFTRDQVADLEAFELLIPDLFARIPGDGKTTVDLQELFFCYTIDSATDFLFGQSVGSLRKEIQLEEDSELEFAEAFNYAQGAVIRRGMMGPVLSAVFRDKKADQCNAYCRDFARRFVDQAVEAVAAEKDITHPSTGRQKYIFSHELAKRTSDKTRILDELMNILLAGRDTTAGLLSNMFFMLAKNPSIWAKLRQEIATLEGRPPTYEELRNFKYLKYCLNESLRLHPVVPMNRRVALCDTVLPVGGGKDGLSPVFVSKGSFVGYNVYAMHRREDFYGPDAGEFRPERWEHLRPGWEYLPFNGGPRICVGQQYALVEASYVTIRLAQEFSVLESRDPGPWEESLALTLSSRNGTKVCLTKA